MMIGLIQLFYVPDSTTTEPGLKSNWNVTWLMSREYRIWVLCGNDTVHSSGVGANKYNQPFFFLDFEYNYGKQEAWIYQIYLRHSGFSSLFWALAVFQTWKTETMLKSPSQQFFVVIPNTATRLKVS